jgi:hypothetical protein
LVKHNDFMPRRPDRAALFRRGRSALLQGIVPELPPGYLGDPTVAVGLTAARLISSGALKLPPG